MPQILLFILINSYISSGASLVGQSVVKNLPANTGTGSTPRSGRYSGEGNGNPLQYSCLGNLMDRGAWWAIVHEVTKRSQSRT